MAGSPAPHFHFPTPSAARPSPSCCSSPSYYTAIPPSLPPPFSWPSAASCAPYCWCVGFGAALVCPPNHVPAAHVSFFIYRIARHASSSLLIVI
jgi:hypothetical protein